VHHRYYMVSSAVPSLHGIVAGRAGLTLFSMGPHTCSPFPRPGVVPGASAMHLPTDYERRLVAGARLLSSAEQRLGPVFGWRKGFFAPLPFARCRPLPTEPFNCASLRPLCPSWRNKHWHWSLLADHPPRRLRRLLVLGSLPLSIERG